MSKMKLDIVADNKPNNLPSAEEIIQQCKTCALANAANSTSDKRGVSLVDESKDGAACAWVKFGPCITMAEARTQHYVAQVVNGDDAAAVRVPYICLSFESHGWGYIVMESIDGVICSDADARLVAAAVQFLDYPGADHTARPHRRRPDLPRLLHRPRVIGNVQFRRIARETYQRCEFSPSFRPSPLTPWLMIPG
jgi:hypothetical protein